jgi:hypothetical protein
VNRTTAPPAFSPFHPDDRRVSAVFVPPRARCAPGTTAAIAEIGLNRKGGPMNFRTLREENTTTSLVTSLAIVLTTLAAVIGPLFAA